VYNTFEDAIKVSYYVNEDDSKAVTMRVEKIEKRKLALVIIFQNYKLNHVIVVITHIREYIVG